MKTFLKPAIFFSAVLLPLSARAAYTTDFSDTVNTGAFTNFAPQNGWTISNSQDELSFVYPGAGVQGKSIGLGGYYSTPASLSTTLSKSISEPALTSGTGLGYFKFDFALINSDGNPLFFDAQDQFGVSLSDSGGSLISINFAPTFDPAIKSVNTVTPSGSNTLVNQGVIPSGYASPGFYTVYLNFSEGAAPGSLHYQGFISGSVQTDFFGDIAGKASTTFTSIGVNYSVLDPALDPLNAGQNFILVDNISIPEPTAAVTGLLALGFLGARRRR